MPALDYERVASLYDSYVQADFDLAFFREECGRIPGPVLELTSGTGRLSLPLIADGVDLTCVDSSPSMLRILRRKLETRKFEAGTVVMDITRLALNASFDLVFIPFHSFSEIVGREMQKRAFAGVRDHLAPGGRFVCTLHNPALRLRTADGVLRLLGHFPVQDSTDTLRLYSQERVVAEEGVVRGWQFYERYSADGELMEKFQLELCFSILTHDGLSSLAAETGFRTVEIFGDYSRGAFDPDLSPVMIWVLMAD